MTKPQAVLRRKDTTSRSALYIAFDLGDKNWQISLGEIFIETSAHQGAETQTSADGRSWPVPPGATRVGLRRSGRL